MSLGRNPDTPRLTVAERRCVRDWLAEDHQKVTSDRPVEAGKHLFVAEFKKTGDDPDTGSALGTMTLYIDTEPVGKADIRTQPGFFA